MFKKTRKPFWVIAGIFLLIGIAFFDYLSGREISIALFYLIPIGLFAWSVSNQAGIIVAVVCAVIASFINILIGVSYSNNLIHVWNGFIRLGLFLFPVLLLKILEQERKQSRTDYLTGVLNSRYFNELLQREIDRSRRYMRPFTVAFIDTDNFKTINDTFGHLYGDSALQAIAEGIQKNLRRTDFVARVGGDEFAVLLPETDESAARSAISHMVKKAVNDLQTKKYPITFSIGVLTLNAPHLTADEILGMTDRLMYLVKNSGKNDAHFEVFSGKVMDNQPARPPAP